MSKMYHSRAQSYLAILIPDIVEGLHPYVTTLFRSIFQLL